mmetsp:Transcript_98344/g.205113  ORF Transcript_98344/g.205113 Transcript_98344/m.205113 type:complete len:271 (-) Transcript_98344:301-1113(-)|eukprot:CAMPEP_0206424212 /NCGR_PEP_ID=MMETSP0324_2-20121206/3105_1 /ASSEMBLY_ACC=CAM_ASM_000836 /TAXON_ID=2866 /ORGANISM="Crypthecodinium cohnii, Strain Seligo" /LENGTH=270 /DNA_ID=CAMNT_0053888847 /DNA_START=434 /DNA_END=1246 /DNA_ORIENTATION=+
MAANLQSASADAGALQEIARDVGKQVEMMILKAKVASETKVSTEISRLSKKMFEIQSKIERIQYKLAQRNPNMANAMRKDDLKWRIQKLEDVWESEVSTLKHELWQTIQAHNHNADLMKHHKEAIDQVEHRVAEASNPSPELKQLQDQLASFDRVVESEQAKQKKIDDLMHRLNQIQTTVLSLQQSPWAGASLSAGASPQLGLGGPGGAPSGAGGAHASGAGGGGQPQGKKAAAKNKGKAKAKAGGGGPSMAQQANMRAEAPEFVPTVSF